MKIAVLYVGSSLLGPLKNAEREINRYCTSIGQACSYKIGHLAWQRSRQKAEAMLGERFDIRRFHEILKEGAMPLTILERRIAERAAAAMRA